MQWDERRGWREAVEHMQFAECLQGYLDQVGCTASELADAAGMPKSTVSRYLTGKRTPNPRGDAPAQIARALAELAAGRGTDLDPDATAQALAQAAGDTMTYTSFPERLANVLDVFGVANNRLARYLSFDPSYISRILSGQRMPADMPRFIDGVAAYVSRGGSQALRTDEVATMLDITPVEVDDPQALAAAVRRYLYDGSTAPQPSADSMARFLTRLDEFDLSDYLREVHFDEIRVPTAPFQLPTTKTYTGIEEMKQAELDFLRAAVLARSTDDVILYSDMPLGEMAEDKEFPKQIMMGMAMLIRKGLHLQNIHDVYRPLDEMMMGLEGWIPIYLTGQMSSYYLPHPTNDVFLHFLRSAGTVAVTGEAIAGNQGGGRYVVTKNPTDVAYLRLRAQELLAHARPLIRVWHEGDTADLERVLRRLERRAGVEPVQVGEDTFQNMRVTVWPRSHALIEKEHSPHIFFLVEHPALVDALERYEPTLF